MAWNERSVCKLCTNWSAALWQTREAGTFSAHEGSLEIGLGVDVSGNVFHLHR